MTIFIPLPLIPSRQGRGVLGFVFFNVHFLGLLNPLNESWDCDKLAGMVRLYIFLLIGIIAISTASIFIKLCDAPVLIIATYRLMVASLMLSPFAYYKKPWRGWERNVWGWLLLSGLLLSLHFASWITSLKYTSVASSVVLVTTHPIFVGLGGRLFLKERLGTYLLLGITLSVLGSGLIGYGDMGLSKEALMGDGLALMGAIAASGYLLVGRKMRKDQELFSYIFPVYSTAGLILIPEARRERSLLEWIIQRRLRLEEIAHGQREAGHEFPQEQRLGRADEPHRILTLPPPSRCRRTG